MAKARRWRAPAPSKLALLETRKTLTLSGAGSQNATLKNGSADQK